MIKRIREALKQELPFFIGVPALVWQVLFLYVPICYLIILSVIKIDAGRTVITLARYAEFFHTPYLKVLLRSFILALGNATLCVCIGYPIAYYLAVRLDRFKTFMLMLLMLPFWTNFLLLTYLHRVYRCTAEQILFVV